MRRVLPVAILLAGCAATPTVETPPPAPAEPVPEALAPVPPAAPEPPPAEPAPSPPPDESLSIDFVEVHLARPKERIRIDAKGDWRHAVSGGEFPERAGEFQRKSIAQYDVDGADVSASYSSTARGWPLVVTIYLYPGPVMQAVDAPASAIAGARESFGRTLVDREADIVRRYHEKKGEEVVETSRVAVTVRARDGEHAGTVVSFDASAPDYDPGKPKSTLLYFFPWSARDWNVKVRATLPRGESAAGEIEGLLEALGWPTKPR